MSWRTRKRGTSRQRGTKFKTKRKEKKFTLQQIQSLNWRLEPHHQRLKTGCVGFWRNKDASGFVEISEVEKGAPAWDQGKYQVSVNTPHTLKTKYFDKLGEAIKFAETFMLENPKG